MRAPAPRPHRPLPAAVAVGAVPLVLGAAGFTSAGIAASSLAAKMMSAAAVAHGGGVPAGSLVAVLQSVGRCPGVRGGGWGGREGLGPGGRACPAPAPWPFVSPCLSSLWLLSEVGGGWGRVVVEEEVQGGRERKEPRVSDVWATGPALPTADTWVALGGSPHSWGLRGRLCKVRGDQ